MQGFITRLTPVKDFDTIASIFTPAGSQDFYLRNARRPNSKRGAQLEILNCIKFNDPAKWRGNQDQEGKLSYISELEIISTFPRVKQTSHFNAEAFTIAEVLTKLLPPHVAQDHLYSQLLAAAELSTAATDEEILTATNFLLLQVMSELGYVPELRQDAVKQVKLKPELSLTLIPDHVGYAQGTKSSVNQDLWRVLKTQIYWLNSNIDFALQVKLTISDLVMMSDIHLDWLENIMESRLKSRHLFGTVLSKLAKHV